MKTTTTLLGLALLVTTGAACSSGDDDDLRANTESIDSSAPAGEGGDGGGDGDSATGDGGGDGDVLGTAKASHPSRVSGNAAVPLRIDVMRLDRSGDLVQLDVALVNEGDKAFKAEDLFADQSNEDPRGEIFEYRNDASNVGLVDGEAQKVYLPAFDDERVCLCSDGFNALELAPGDTFHIVATYGGVPGDLDTLDVNVPGFPAITGVPVS